MYVVTFHQCSVSSWIFWLHKNKSSSRILCISVAVWGIVMANDCRWLKMTKAWLMNPFWWHWSWSITVDGQLNPHGLFSHSGCRWTLTFAVLQHRLHGTLPLIVPAYLCRAGALRVFRLPALPQVHLHTVIQQEQSWRSNSRSIYTTWAAHPGALRGNIVQVMSSTVVAF